MPVSTLSRTPLALAILFAFGTLGHAPARAQSADARLQGDPDSVPTVVVSASALGLLEDDMITPVTSLSGGALVRARESTLGETLANQPGITSSHFGAGASRPVIRGMDGPRVKILSDGAEVQDASTISPDHAVAFEPVLAERIEVLRGPSALAYGGGAVGGVVNILDRKIPTRVPQKIEGSAEVRANSVAREKTGAFEVTGGAGNIAVHAEGIKRDAGEYRVGKGWNEGRRVHGSFKDTETGTVGLSWVGESGYLGAAYTRERTEYGIPGHNDEFGSCHPHGDHLHCGGHGHEEEGEEHDHGHAHEGEVPVVQLDSARWDLRGEYRNPVPGITRARLRASFTDYRHDELEQGLVATSFKSRAHDARVEFEHAPILGWRGVFGAQTTRRDFTTKGEEAYVPPTVTKRHAVFLTEEYKLDDWRFEAGARHEWQDIAVDNARFAGARDSDARGTSVALGAVWKFQPQYSLRAGISRAHRLPAAEELYANGVHLTTATYEIGNQDLGKETSNNVDLTLRKFEGDTTFSLSAFHNRVDQYVYTHTLDNHEGFQLVEYAQRDTIFTGLEGELRHKLSPVLEATLFGDTVRARFDQGSGSRNIPRIPAHRIGVRLNADWQAWHGLVELVRVGKQERTAEFESRTGGYNMLNLGTHYTTRIGGVPAQFYARLNNLTDELAFSHTSFIKNAAPLPGRNLTAGLRLIF